MSTTANRGICACGHWAEEHPNGACETGCGCKTFTRDRAENTPAAKADRGSDLNRTPSLDEECARA